MKDKLEPCPFCGNTGVDDIVVVGSRAWITCNNCRTLGPEAETREEAVKLWNKRTARIKPVNINQIIPRFCKKIRKMTHGEMYTNTKPQPLNIHGQVDDRKNFKRVCRIFGVCFLLCLIGGLLWIITLFLATN